MESFRFLVIDTPNSYTWRILLLSVIAITKFYFWKVFLFLGTQFKRQKCFVFLIRLFSETPQQSDNCCYVTSDPLFFQENPKKISVLFDEVFSTFATQLIIHSVIT